MVCTLQYVELAGDNQNFWWKKFQANSEKLDPEQTTYRELMELIFNRFGELRKVRTATYLIDTEIRYVPYERNFPFRNELLNDFKSDGYIGTKEQKVRRSLRLEFGSDDAKEDERYVTSGASSLASILSQINDIPGYEAEIIDDDLIVTRPPL